MARVFISYAHTEEEWVYQRLVPVLEAGGAEVLIDRRLGLPGIALGRQIESWQAGAARHLLVLTGNYAQRRWCREEMLRAIGLDPDFRFGTVIAIRRDDGPIPPELSREDPLYVDLRDDRAPAPWALLLRGCDADLGVSAPEWLRARDEVVGYLEDRRSVNLVVGPGVRWRPLLDHLRTRPGVVLPVIDLESGAVAERSALLQAMLHGLGSCAALPDQPKDLIAFQKEIVARGFSCVALVHFDLAPYHFPDDVPLFAAWRHLINTERKLALLVQSHAPFQTLLPRNHPLSEIDLATVTLSATP